LVLSALSSCGGEASDDTGAEAEGGNGFMSGSSNGGQGENASFDDATDEPANTGGITPGSGPAGSATAAPVGAGATGAGSVVQPTGPGAQNPGTPGELAVGDSEPGFEASDPELASGADGASGPE